MNLVLVQMMNQVLSDWKATYDTFTAVPEVFSLGVGDQIYLGTQPLLQLPAGTSLVSSQFDANQISFSFSNFRSIMVYIEWPEDMPPRVSGLFF